MNVIDADSEPEKCTIINEDDTRDEMHITNMEDVMQISKFTDESSALYPINESPEANLNRNYSDITPIKLQKVDS